MTFPADNGRYNSTTWGAGGCAAGTNRICGTSSAGTTSVRVSIQRSSNSQWWTGNGWSNTQQSVLATGTTSWSTQVATSQLSNGVTYTVTSWSIAGAVQSPNTVRTFVYDTTAPTTTAANLATTDKDGDVEIGDTFSVTFDEALDPTSVPGPADAHAQQGLPVEHHELGHQRADRRHPETGTGGYINGTAFSTRTLTYAGTLTLSNNNSDRHVHGDGNVRREQLRLGIDLAGVRAFQFRPATSLRDVAGNAPSATTTNAASTVMF